MPPPPPPTHHYAAPPPPAPVQSRSSSILTRLATGIITSLLLLSIGLNVYLGTWFAASMRSGAYETTYEEGDAEHRIVILPAVGLVNEEMEHFIQQALRKLKDDPPAAIVLRVDSPGGDPFSSDRIVHHIDKFKQAHPGVPIVASFGTVAASGGYYISAGSDQILAEPLCRTGSIGVISMNFTIRELMEKVGVKAEVLTATGSPMKDVANNPFRDFNDADRREVQELIDQLHTRFVSVVHQGRSNSNLTLAEVEQLADGQVMSTAEAMSAKLIDGEGFLDDALATAQGRAQIPAGVEPKITQMRYAGRVSLLGLLTHNSGAPASLEAAQVREWLVELQTPRVEYRYYPAGLR